MSEDRDDLRPATAPRPSAPGRDGAGGGRFSRRTLRGPRTAEEYLKADSPPAYVRRLRAIELEYGSHRRQLEAAYRALLADCGHDAELFSRRWGARARRWRFDDLNQLIRAHNTWYPAEANLPMDPRMKDYVPIGGRSYRRIELGPDWILEHFPPAPASRNEAPRLPTRVPRDAS